MGLHYPGVETVLRIRKVRDRAQVFGDIQVMERAAIPVLNERDDV